MLKEIPMTMKDWIAHVDRILTATGEDLLTHNGTVSKEQMTKKVKEEYRQYSHKTLSQVEKDYLEEIKKIEKIADNKKD